MRAARLMLRLLIVAVAAAASARIVDRLAPAAAWPALSPLLSGCSALARRSASWLAAAGLPLLVLALLRGRWFCRRLCPTGILLTGLGRLGRRPTGFLRRVPVLGPALCLAMIGGALAGLPLFLALDPLSLFSGFFSLWRAEHWRWTALLPGAGLILLGIASVIWPCLWCERLCPLGACQALLGRAGRALRVRPAADQNGSAPCDPAS